MNKSKNTALGLRIREIRRAHKLTQKAFASMLGVESSYISKLEKGRRPSLQLLYGICRTFNVNKEWLETGKEPDKEEMLVKVTEPAVYGGPVPEAGIIPEKSRDDLIELLFDLVEQKTAILKDMEKHPNNTALHHIYGRRLAHFVKLKREIEQNNMQGEVEAAVIEASSKGLLSREAADEIVLRLLQK